MNHELRVVTLQPTVFFRRCVNGDLEQQCLLTVENDGENLGEVSLELSIDFPGNVLDDAPDGSDPSAPHPSQFSKRRILLGEVISGESQHTIYLPDLGKSAVMHVLLFVGTRKLDTWETMWQQQKRWDLYLVHGSHHDLGYTDIPSNVLLEHDCHLDKVIKYCEQTAGWNEDVKFRYVVEQAWSVLHFIENRPPETVAKLVEFIRQGRIEVTALLDNLTSELCGHEQQVRSVYPAFHLARKFEFPISSAEHNDIPGISWGLVSVLSGSGVRYFAPSVQDYFAWGFKVHPNWDEEALLARDMPGAFWWQGPDGDRVLCWFSGDSIQNAWLWDLEQSENELPVFLENISAGGYEPDIVRVKILGGRRDNAPPDLRISQVARDWNERWAFPRLRVSTNAEFFERFEREFGDTLRTLRGDLPNTDYPIGAVSHAKEVAVNRKTHDLLPAAEKFAAVAAMMSEHNYPADMLREAYEYSLYHDGHCGGMAHPMGPAQDAAWSQKHEFAYRAAALAHDVLVKSTNRIADQVRLDQEGYHIVVFNSLAHKRTDVVRMMIRPPDPCGMPMYWREPAPGDTGSRELVPSAVTGRQNIHLPLEELGKPFEFVDVVTGKHVPVQLVRLDDPLAAQPMASQRWALGQIEKNNPEVILQHGGHSLELVFTAEDVPSLGYKTYHLIPAEEAESSLALESSLRAGDHWLENSFYRIELDPQRGTVTSLYDKILKREWVDRDSRFGFNQLLVRSPQTGAISVPEYVEIQPGERGPLCASLIIKTQAFGCPQLTWEVTLYEGVKRVDFANRVLKDATPLLELYFAFPFLVENPEFHIETSNAVVTPIRDQLPGTNTDAYTIQHWVSVGDDEHNFVWSSLDAPVAVLGDLWPGYVSQAHHGITPPGYGHEFLRQPDQFTQGHIYSYLMNNNFRTNFDPVQVADLLFRYSFSSHSGDWRAGNAPGFGWEVSNPLETVCLSGPQTGSLGEAASFCSLDCENVQLLALKNAEDGDGLILRLEEMQGRDCLVTIYLPLFEIERVYSCNLVEDIMESLEYSQHQFQTNVSGNGIKTVRVLFKS